MRNLDWVEFKSTATEINPTQTKTIFYLQIEDKSSNGTSVNDKLVGKNKSAVIDHNSLISIAKTKAYVFMVRNI